MSEIEKLLSHKIKNGMYRIWTVDQIRLMEEMPPMGVYVAGTSERRKSIAKKMCDGLIPARFLEDRNGQ